MVVFGYKQFKYILTIKSSFKYKFTRNQSFRIILIHKHSVNKKFHCEMSGAVSYA